MRTFDIGGDKVIAHSHEEENPFLGWRGIRVALDRPETFLAQMRAMLRASTKKNIWVMFPMISSLKEVRRAKALVDAGKGVAPRRKGGVRRYDEDRRDDRGAVGRGRCGRHSTGSRFPQYRHERPHSIPARS